MSPDRLSTAYDPSRAEIIRDPFPAFAQLQDNDPAHWCAPLQGWVFTRYDDVLHVINDRSQSADRLTPFFEHASGERNRFSDLARYLGHWMVFRDPPDHTRLRRLFNRVFTSSAVERLTPTIERIVSTLIDEMENHLRLDEPIDLIADFAYPLPATIIMEMLGVPTNQLDQVKQWSDDIALFIGSAQASSNKYEQAQQGAQAMGQLFSELVYSRTKTPRDDMITTMIQARDSDGTVSEEEIVSTCILLLFAGHETTTNLIGNGVFHALRSNTPWKRLCADPKLIATGVEEFLRYDGPIGAISRIAKRPYQSYGKTIPEGARVFAMINAANRDPRRFEQAHEMKVDRKDNQHITFGYGIHFCLGAPLARLEGQIAVRELARRLPKMKLSTDVPQWTDSLVLRGIRSLPVYV